MFRDKKSRIFVGFRPFPQWREPGTRIGDWRPRASFQASPFPYFRGSGAKGGEVEELGEGSGVVRRATFSNQPLEYAKNRTSHSPASRARARAVCLQLESSVIRSLPRRKNGVRPSGRTPLKTFCLSRQTGLAYADSIFLRALT